MAKSILSITEDKNAVLTITAEEKIKVLQASIDRLQFEER